MKKLEKWNVRLEETVEEKSEKVEESLEKSKVMNIRGAGEKSWKFEKSLVPLDRPSQKTKKLSDQKYLLTTFVWSHKIPKNAN